MKQNKQRRISRHLLLTLALLVFVAIGTATTTFIGTHTISAPTQLESEYDINVLWDSFSLETDLPDLTGASMQQASYFVYNATINGQPITEEDYIIAFRYSEVVGYTNGWNQANMREVMVYGDSELGFWSTYGLMRNGEIPTFRIYDASTGELLDAVLTHENFNTAPIKFDNLIMPFVSLTA